MNNIYFCSIFDLQDNEFKIKLDNKEIIKNKKVKIEILVELNERDNIDLISFVVCVPGKFINPILDQETNNNLFTLELLEKNILSKKKECSMYTEEDDIFKISKIINFKYITNNYSIQRELPEITSKCICAKEKNDTTYLVFKWFQTIDYQRNIFIQNSFNNQQGNNNVIQGDNNDN